MPVKGRYHKLFNEPEMASTTHREKKSILSLLSFYWITETFKTGYSRPLEQWDLLPIEEQSKTKVLTEKLQGLWHEERRASQRCGKIPRLWRCVLKMFRAKEIFNVFVLRTIEISCGILRVLLLGVILSTLTSANEDNTMMYVSAVLLGVVSIGQSLVMHLRCWMNETQGAKLCSALKGIVYSKITLVGLQEFQEGHVIDLLSNDIQRMELAVRYGFEMISIIFLAPVSIYVFLNLFHWRALTGVLVLFGVVPYFLFVSYLIGKLRWQTAQVSDKRITLTNELLSGIRAVKTQACEQNYGERLKEIRKQEITKICQKSLLTSTVVAIKTCSGSIAVLLSTLFLVLGNWELTPASAFVLLSFMNFFNIVPFGKGLQVLFEAVVSLRRIEEFLLLENLSSLSFDYRRSLESLTEDDESESAKNHTDYSYDRTNTHLIKESKGKSRTNYRDEFQELIVSSKNKEGALIVSNLSYKMNGVNKCILDDVSFVTPTKSLTVICGQVGSGKSTLLSAIAGEVNLCGGIVRYPKPLAYIPQEPWVFSGTIKENILFSETYYPDWYATVVEACSLKDDIRLFPEKDETIVGQRGAVLSGGQKARVSLARAVYSCANVYILDDPLSAVDQKVGDQIFEKCICGLLSEKIRVLVSHHSRHLQEADQIVILDNGRVQEKIAPHQRRRSKGDGVLMNDSIDKHLVDRHPLVRQSSADEPKGLEIPDEDRVIGNVSFRLYWDYFTSGIHPASVVALIVFFILSQSAVIFPDVWLSYLSKRTLEEQQKVDNLVIYTSAVAASLVLIAIRVFLFFLASLSASQQLHNKMVEALLYANLLFFDTIPTGRILNRFSRDIGSMDEQLPEFSISCIQCTLVVVTAALLPAIANPLLMFILLPLLAVFILFSRYYLKTSREIKRLESICRSPVLSHASETMAGLETIRSRGMAKRFNEQFYRYQDVHSQAFYMVFESTRWFGLRVDLLCVPFITCAALATVIFSTDPAMAGLSLAYVMDTVDTTQYAIRLFSEVENLMTSVERVMSYTNLECESGYKTIARPPAYWPRDGQVSFYDVTMTYHDGGPQALKKVFFNIEGKSHIGVTGRTGAGKSSIVEALLRMPDPQGDVIIDEVRIKDVNLQESRRCISVLSQVPVLFSGSLRQNIDPMNEHEDVDLWAALEDVRLKSFVENLNGQLDYELLERGANLSVGERQLVCLARILLQQNKIVILDEPTAHVDPVTEKTIWKTVIEKLKNCTVITIAHRLDTIKHCDMILVLREGEVAEFGTFGSLVDRERGVLAGLASIAKEKKRNDSEL